MFGIISVIFMSLPIPIIAPFKLIFQFSTPSLLISYGNGLPNNIALNSKSDDHLTRFRSIPIPLVTHLKLNSTALK